MGQMKKQAMLLGLAALMMGTASDFYGAPTRPKRGRVQPEDESVETKKRRHQQYGTDLTEHDYVINGETIRATSKKVARKIYEKRHKTKK